MKQELLAVGQIELAPYKSLILNTHKGFIEILDKRDPDNTVFTDFVAEGEYAFLGKSPLLLNTADKHYQFHMAEKAITGDASLIPNIALKELLPLAILGHTLTGVEGSNLYRSQPIQLQDETWIKLDDHTGQILQSKQGELWIPIYREDCVFKESDLKIFKNRHVDNTINNQVLAGVKSQENQPENLLQIAKSILVTDELLKNNNTTQQEQASKKVSDQKPSKINSPKRNPPDQNLSF